MISNDVSICPECGGELKYYDKVPRMVRVKGRNKQYVQLRRFRCVKCYKLHRELPDNIFPYKQYDADIIRGVKEGLITSDTLGYEDSPCDMTMLRWLHIQNLTEFSLDMR